jgi:nicotinamide-nucleotide amidase
VRPLVGNQGKKVNAEIISIGTELLLGEVTDTNAAYLAGQLPLLGIDLHRVTLVGDNLERLSEAFSRAWEHCDIILATGGLGPTEDDLTREAIAQMLGEELRSSPELEEELRAIFARMGRAMPPHNIKQATLIPSAQAIPNPRGTAPGWWIEKGKKIMVAMPGPPGEMQRMWEKEVMPRLQERLQKEVILFRTLKSFGFSEAEVDEMASPLFSLANPEIGIYAKPDGIHLRLIARAQKREEAEKLIARGEAQLRAIFAHHIWGTDSDTLEGVVGALLASKDLTLATMESCTGGLLATTLTDVPGSSVYYKGGFVAYSNEAKIALEVDARLIDQHGAVSPEVAEAMAEAARLRLEADIGVGITGVAGPDKLEGKPPGIAYIAICDSRGKRSIKGNYPPRRPEVKRLATAHTLFLLRQRLLGL